MFFFDPWFLILVTLPGLVMSGIASWMVKTRFNHYSRVPSTTGYTGAMAAQKSCWIARGSMTFKLCGAKDSCRIITIP
ncbi:MAG: zinc metallopeptidase [Pirellulaceae bacterium]